MAAPELWVLVHGVSAKRAGTDFSDMDCSLAAPACPSHVIEAELLRTATRTRTSLRPSHCRFWMSWKRLLSRILGILFPDAF